MSLAFLAKKSWHTTNISNQEKVWLKQQEQEREKKKLELLQKQMKEEREMEDMRQASGQARPTEKLNWMYSQPINLNTDDEYLMGKMKEPEKEDEELKKVLKTTKPQRASASPLPAFCPLCTCASRPAACVSSACSQ